MIGEPIALRFGLVVISEANARSNWQAKAKRVKAQRGAVALFLNPLAQRIAALEPPWAVTLIRYGLKPLDPDNLAGSFKAVQDQVAVHLGVDDGDRARVRWAYEQRLVTTKHETGIGIVIVGEERYRNIGLVQE